MGFLRRLAELSKKHLILLALSGLALVILFQNCGSQNLLSKKRNTDPKFDSEQFELVLAKLESKRLGLPIEVFRDPSTGELNATKIYNSQTGDAVINTSQLASSQSSVPASGTSASGLPSTSSLPSLVLNTQFWLGGPLPDGYLPIKFASSVSLPQKELFAQACQSLANLTQISCVDYHGERNYVLVKNVSGQSYSNLGRLTGTYNEIGMGPNAGLGTVIHEILHTLGFPHTQQWKNRDDYICVHPNLVRDMNYKIYEKFPPVNSSFEFNPNSLMQYRKQLVSSEQPNSTQSSATCDSQNFNVLAISDLIRNIPFGSDSLSESDIRNIKKLYRCSGGAASCQGSVSLTLNGSNGNSRGDYRIRHESLTPVLDRTIKRGQRFKLTYNIVNDGSEEWDNRFKFYLTSSDSELKFINGDNRAVLDRVPNGGGFQASFDLEAPDDIRAIKFTAYMKMDDLIFPEEGTVFTSYILDSNGSGVIINIVDSEPLGIPENVNWQEVPVQIVNLTPNSISNYKFKYQFVSVQNQALTQPREILWNDLQVFNQDGSIRTAFPDTIPSQGTLTLPLVLSVNDVESQLTSMQNFGIKFILVNELNATLAKASINVQPRPMILNNSCESKCGRRQGDFIFIRQENKSRQDCENDARNVGRTHFCVDQRLTGTHVFDQFRYTDGNEMCSADCRSCWYQVVSVTVDCGTGSPTPTPPPACNAGEEQGRSGQQCQNPNICNANTGGSTCYNYAHDDCWTRSTCPSGCTPNCGNPADHCPNETWSDGCTGTCSGGTKTSGCGGCTPNCGNPADHCPSETWSDGCTGTCSGGTKTSGCGGPICNPVTQPAGDWGEKNGQCLPSCGALGGTENFNDPCGNHGMDDAGAAYDVTFCCKERPQGTPQPTPTPTACQPSCPNSCEGGGEPNGCGGTCSARAPCGPSCPLPEPHYVIINGNCVPSCGAAGGTASCTGNNCCHTQFNKNEISPVSDDWGPNDHCCR